VSVLLVLLVSRDNWRRGLRWSMFRLRPEAVFTWLGLSCGSICYISTLQHDWMSTGCKRPRVLPKVRSDGVVCYLPRAFLWAACIQLTAGGILQSKVSYQYFERAVLRASEPRTQYLQGWSDISPQENSTSKQIFKPQHQDTVT
jgi:hypothetical protein